jgi:hypothetical protein
MAAVQLAAMHCPCTPALLVAAVVLQMLPAAHCASEVQPPHWFGVENPQVGVGAAQSVLVRQPAAHTPEKHFVPG